MDIFSDIGDALNVFNASRKKVNKNPTDAELCTEIKKSYNSALAQRTPIEPSIKRNLWYFENRMNYDYDKGKSSFEEVFKKKYKLAEYVPVNLMFRIFETKYSVLATMPLDFVVDAGSSEIEDETSSKIAERLLNGKVKGMISDKTYTLLYWALWGNRTIAKVYWDKNMGDIMTLPEIVYEAEQENIPIVQRDEKGQVKADSQGIPLLEQTTDGKPKYLRVVKGIPQFNVFREGDVRLSILSPFEYVVDPMAKGENVFNPSIAEHPARWVCQTDIVSKEFVRQNYNLTEKQLDKIKWSTKIMMDGIEADVNKMRGVQMNAEGVEAVQLYEYWERPSVDFPEGRLVTFVDGNIVLQNTTLPQPFLRLDRLPFTELVDIVVPWRYWGKTNLEMIAPLQQAYTKDVSHFQYLLNKQGRKLMTIQGSGGKIREIKVPEDMADKALAYDSGQQMQISTYDGFSLPLLRSLEQWLRDIEMVSGTSDLKYPVRTQTATEIMKIVEQDASRMGRFKKSYVRCVTDIGYLALMLMKENYIIGRKVKILGDYDRVEIMTFDKNKISESYNVDIQSAGIYYGSRVGKLQMIKEVAQLIPLVQDPARIKEYGKVISKVIDELLEIKYHTQTDWMLDTKEANKEDLILLNTPNDRSNPMAIPQIWNAIAVTEFQNHSVHIEEHTRFLKQYDEKLSAQQTTFMMEHIQKHKGIQDAQLVHLMQLRQAMAQPVVPNQPQEQEQIYQDQSQDGQQEPQTRLGGA